MPAPALVAVTILNFAPVLVNGVREGSVDAASDTLGIAVLGLAFTVLIGVSIVNISKQSAERAELITALEASRAEAAALSHEAGAAGGVDDVPASLPTRVQVVLVRAVQEALTNVRRHAGASSVTVDLVAHDDVVTLTIDDDGTGFDTAASAPGYGLPGMRNRVEQLGGVLTIRSAPGAGTTVTCEVPR